MGNILDELRYNIKNSTFINLILIIQFILFFWQSTMILSYFLDMPLYETSNNIQGDTAYYSLGYSFSTDEGKEAAANQSSDPDYISNQAKVYDELHANPDLHFMTFSNVAAIPVEYEMLRKRFTDQELLEYNRDVFCSRALRDGSYLASKGKVAVPYGNWGYYYSGIVDEGWRTFEDYARYTTNYAGLRNRLALLLEVYSYDDFETRVETQYECIYGALQVVAEDKEEIKEMIAAADARSAARAEEGIDPEKDIVALNSEMTILNFEGKDKLTVMSYETDETGQVIGTRLYDDEGDPYAIEHGEPVDYETDYWGTFVPTDVEAMGAYYLIDQDCEEFIELMEFHGVELTQLEEDLTLAGEEYLHFAIQSYTSGGAVVDGRPRDTYEGHYQTLVSGEWEAGDKEIVIPAGTYVISTAQSLGSLAALMCEPAAVDGGVAWNFFDDYFDAKEGTFRANYTNTVTAEAGSENERTEEVSIPILKIPEFATIAVGE